MHTKPLTVLLTTFTLLGGCASTEPTREFTNLPVNENGLPDEIWPHVKRVPPLYPVQNAKRGIHGCATVEYVLTPENKVKDLRVVETTSRYFGDAALDAFEKWDFSDVPAGLVSKPTKVQSRLDFCLNEPDAPCDSIEPDYFCPGSDTIKVTGSIIKRAVIRR